MSQEIDPTLTGDKKPAGLQLRDGSVVTLPELTLEEARDAVYLAIETGALIGNEIDPKDVETIVLIEEERRA